MILVSGGTGMVGSAIVKELLRRGEKVAVLGRDAEKIRKRLGTSVEVRVGDVREPATLAAAMQGIDVVVNAVQFPGSPIENRGKGFTFEEVDLKGTRQPGRCGEGGRRAALRLRQRRRRGEGRREALVPLQVGGRELPARRAGSSGWSCGRHGCTDPRTSRSTASSASRRSCRSCRCSAAASRTCSRCSSMTSGARRPTARSSPKPRTSCSRSAGRTSCR